MDKVSQTSTNPTSCGYTCRFRWRPIDHGFAHRVQCACIWFLEGKVLAGHTPRQDEKNKQQQRHLNAVTTSLYADINYRYAAMTTLVGLCLKIRLRLSPFACLHMSPTCLRSFNQLRKKKHLCPTRHRPPRVRICTSRFYTRQRLPIATYFPDAFFAQNELNPT